MVGLVLADHTLEWCSARARKVPTRKRQPGAQCPHCDALLPPAGLTVPVRDGWDAFGPMEPHEGWASLEPPGHTPEQANAPAVDHPSGSAPDPVTPPPDLGPFGNYVRRFVKLAIAVAGIYVAWVLVWDLIAAVGDGPGNVAWWTQGDTTVLGLLGVAAAIGALIWRDT